MGAGGWREVQDLYAKEKASFAEELGVEFEKKESRRTPEFGGEYIAGIRCSVSSTF